ncbi:MAG TPA: FAD-dependent monooxygenase [Dehalococcoidia bacterium]|nr:FAD-dependent monooxygenase [Dehalococcoidia bacterium]
MTTHDVQVLIAGSGPVGLTLAIDLVWRGVRCTVRWERRGQLWSSSGGAAAWVEEAVVLDA